MSITENMGKKSLVALMAVSALVPVMSVEVSADTPNAEGDFEFSNGVITKYVGGSKDVVIPSEIGGVAVTEIGSQAFFNKNLRSVEIPNSVTEIGRGAFNGNNLRSVEIPNTVTGIGDSAFYSNNLTSVVIPESVTFIRDKAFSNNELTSVEIPNSVTSIGYNPFMNNPHLETITVDSNNPNFMSTDNNHAIYTKDGKKLITGTALMANNMLDTVTEIGYSAFEGMKISSVGIPESVTVIGESAFQNNELTSVEIPNSVTVIGSYVFFNNNLTSVEIPNSVTSIGYEAFSHNELTSVEIPNSVTEIGGLAFRYNDLTSVEIPNSVTSIGNWAFRYNPLTKVTIPETVTSIGSGAFLPSSPLTTADVPIYGETGSQAETYATTNGHPFNPSDDIDYSQDATLNLFGGTLSLDAPLFESFGTHELNSDVQTITSNFLDTFKVYDARGTGEGWRLDVTATHMKIAEPEDGFKEGTSTHVLPVGTLALDQLESIEPFNDSKGILPSPILDTTSIIDDGAVTIAKADVGEGMGAFELTFGEGAFSATIDPSTAKIDKINYPDSDTPYEATVTWTLVSAP